MSLAISHVNAPTATGAATVVVVGVTVMMIVAMTAVTTVMTDAVTTTGIGVVPGLLLVAAAPLAAPAVVPGPLLVVAAPLPALHAATALPLAKESFD